MSESEDIGISKEVTHPEKIVTMQMVLREANSILDGTFPYNDLEVDDQSEGGSVLLVDLNRSTPEDEATAMEWITAHLGSSPDQARVARRIVSPDGQTRMDFFEAALDQPDNTQAIVRVQTDGDKPSFMLWPPEMSDFQIECGYTEEKVTEITDNS